MRPISDGNHIQRLQKWIDEDCQNQGQFEADLQACLAENARLREALEHIKSDAEYPQQAYDRNGPSFTSPSGIEYDFTSDFLAKCNEISELARKALENE